MAGGRGAPESGAGAKTWRGERGPREMGKQGEAVVFRPQLQNGPKQLQVGCLTVSVSVSAAPRPHAGMLAMHIYVQQVSLLTASVTEHTFDQLVKVAGSCLVQNLLHFADTTKTSKVRFLTVYLRCIFNTKL